jgi:hypothetical protein
MFNPYFRVEQDMLYLSDVPGLTLFLSVQVGNICFVRLPHLHLASRVRKLEYSWIQSNLSMWSPLLCSYLYWNVTLFSNANEVIVQNKYFQPGQTKTELVQGHQIDNAYPAPHMASVANHDDTSIILTRTVWSPLLCSYLYWNVTLFFSSQRKYGLNIF